MIGIIDYKFGGNIHAFKNVFRLLNVPYICADRPELLEDCNKIILPGVGSFDGAIKSLQNSGFYDFMMPKIKEATNLNIKVVAVGTGQAIENSMPHVFSQGVKISRHLFRSTACKNQAFLQKTTFVN